MMLINPANKTADVSADPPIEAKIEVPTTAGSATAGTPRA
jgi:hypothetical protein